MIPLVTHSDHIEKLVLIGDHKQLQPVILCWDALAAGLGVSLFERFAQQHGAITVMLTEQYRMVFFTAVLRTKNGANETT